MSMSASFLRRWSDLKLRQATEPAGGDAAQPLPPPETLDSDADFSAYMRPEVDAETRGRALRRLFMTDHYRAMDGLDVYVGDYSAPTPLAAAVLATLAHTRTLLPPAQEIPATPAAEPPEQA